LGTFDTESGRFLDTTPQAFIRDFALASLVKGHFMANKGYRLPGLPDVSTTWTTVQRSKAGSRAVPLGLRFELLDKAHGRCRKCGHGVRDGLRLHVDHKEPYSRGGKTEKANLQVLCERCNIGKGNRFSR
jgi:HNH endonuclease